MKHLKDWAKCSVNSLTETSGFWQKIQIMFDVMHLIYIIPTDYTQKYFSNFILFYKNFWEAHFISRIFVKQGNIKGLLLLSGLSKMS